MKKLNLFFLIAGLLFIYACTPALSIPPPERKGILVKVHVLTDPPPPGSGFKLREGEPKSVGVYEFYLKDPELPGSGEFKRLGRVPLKRLSGEEFYGEKRIAKMDGTLCIGYPSTNLIDGKACVEIDQSKDEVEITVHYWKTSLGIF